MKKNDIINTFKRYGTFKQILSCINEDKAWGDNYLKMLEDMHFATECDLILYVRNH